MLSSSSSSSSSSHFICQNTATNNWSSELAAYNFNISIPMGNNVYYTRHKTQNTDVKNYNIMIIKYTSHHLERVVHYSVKYWMPEVWEVSSRHGVFTDDSGGQ